MAIVLLVTYLSADQIPLRVNLGMIQLKTWHHINWQLALLTDVCGCHSPSSLFPTADHTVCLPVFACCPFRISREVAFSKASWWWQRSGSRPTCSWHLCSSVCSCSHEQFLCQFYSKPLMSQAVTRCVAVHHVGIHYCEIDEMKECPPPPFHCPV